MVKFDQAQLDRLERREFQLSILASVIVLVMASGVALLMYPLVFVHGEEGNKWPLRFAFFGFCALSVLFVAYLLDHHKTVRRLKQQLVAELQRNLELRNQSHADLLHTIPDLNHFRDRLVMEYRRASTMERPLSLLAIKLKLSSSLTDANDKTVALGEAAKAMTHILRETDSIYLFGPGAFSLVLPDTDTADARLMRTKIEDSLRTAGDGKFSFEMTFCNYPATTQSAHDLEEAVSALLLENQPWMESVTSR